MVLDGTIQKSYNTYGQQTQKIISAKFNHFHFDCYFELLKKKKKANNFCEKRKKMNLKLIISNLQAWQGLFATLEALIYC